MTSRRLLFGAGVATLCAWVLLPVYLVALGAFGGRAAVFRWPKTLWPSDVSLQAMLTFLQVEGVLRAFTNSLIAAGLTVLFSILLGAPAGYALARFTFPGKDAYRLLVLLTRAFPLWQETHASIDQLVAGCRPNDLRGALRALS